MFLRGDGLVISPHYPKQNSVFSISSTHGDNREPDENASDKCRLKSVGDDGAAAVGVNSQLHRRVVTIATVRLEHVVMDTRSHGVDVTATEWHTVRVEFSVILYTTNNRPRIL